MKKKKKYNKKKINIKMIIYFITFFLYLKNQFYKFNHKKKIKLKNKKISKK